MIRLNLLKPLQIPAPAERMAELGRAPSKTGRIGIVSLLILIAAGAGLYFAIQNSKFKPKAEPIVVQAVESPPVPAPEPEPVKAVAEMVDSVQAVNADPIFHLLKDLLAATPPGVGFSNVEFSPPGTFHVHGVAESETDLNQFQKSLGASAGIELAVDRVVPVGPGKAAREFFFSGEARYAGAGGIRTVALNRLETALQNFMNAAAAQHVDLETLQLKDSSTFQGTRSFHYTADARCEYSDLQTLLGKMQKARSSIGFERITLEARDGEKMAARLALILYAQ